MPQLGKGRSVVLVDPDAHKVATHPSASPESLRCARPRATPQTSGPGTYRFVVIGSTGSHSIYSITGSASAPGPARGRSNRAAAPVPPPASSGRWESSNRSHPAASAEDGTNRPDEAGGGTGAAARLDRPRAGPGAEAEPVML